jgi:hypothetical protein
VQQCGDEFKLDTEVTLTSAGGLELFSAPLLPYQQNAVLDPKIEFTLLKEYPNGSVRLNASATFDANYVLAGLPAWATVPANPEAKWVGAHAVHTVYAQTAGMRVMRPSILPVVTANTCPPN